MFLSRRRDVDARRGGARSCSTATAASTSRSRPAFSVRPAVWMERAGCSPSPTSAGAASTGGPGTTPGGWRTSSNVFDDFCGCARWLADRAGRRRTHRHQRRLERRAAGRRLPHPAPRAVRRGGARGGRARHAALPQVHDRLGLEERFRRPGRSRAVPLAARLLAAAQRPQPGVATRRRW